MEFIGRTKPKLLIADEGKHIRSINDIYVSATETEPEHKPYYSTLIFLGEQINSLEECQEIYVEEDV